ncbi:MAG TPA: hypothetical protein VHS03_06755, partial [Gaiellaceae bacterium]|nr:hypothetical protein [Gaiellaceae bacterium]
LADLALNAGRFDEARRRWEWAVARQREQGLPDEADTMPRFGLGAVAFEEHRLDDARRDFVAAYDLAGRAAFPNMAALALAGLAAVEAARGEAETAAIRAGQAWELMDRTGGEPRGNEATLFEFARSEAAAALGDERFAELLAEGRATPYEHTFPSDTPG